MSTPDIVLGSILIAVSVFLIIAVLLQHGKSHGLSGTIAGGAETFFGKSKAQTLDKKLSILTSIVAVVFVVLVLTVYLRQDVTDISGIRSDYVASDTTAAADNGANAGDTTAAAGDTTAAATDAATDAVTDAPTDAAGTEAAE